MRPRGGPIGNLFVANASGSLYEYANLASAATAKLPTAGIFAEALGADANNNLFVGGTNGAARLAPPYSSAGNIHSGANTFDFAVDDLGNVFAGFENGVEEYAPGATSPTRTISGAQPQGLATGDLFDLFVGQLTSSLIYVNPYTTGVGQVLAGNGGSIATHDAYVFVGDAWENVVRIYTYPYDVGPVVTISQGIGGPVVATDPATGNLFVANILEKTILEYTPPYTGAPVTLASADGGVFQIQVYNGDLFALSQNGIVAYSLAHPGKSDYVWHTTANPLEINRRPPYAANANWTGGAASVPTANSARTTAS